MDCIEGESLSQSVKRPEALSENEVMGYIRAMAESLFCE